MERAVALKKLRVLLGPDFAYKVRPKAPSPEERECAKSYSRVLLAERKRAGEALEARRHELIATDATYQKLLGEYKTATKAVEKNNAALYVHKVTVGTANGLFFRVTAQGDSWEEVIRLVIAGRKNK